MIDIKKKVQAAKDYASKSVLKYQRMQIISRLFLENMKIN